MVASAEKLNTERLPNPLTGLVGREETLAALQTLLINPATRLVTLTGPGGVGKTRLSLEVARRWPEGGRVFFVSLAALRDPALLLPALAQTLGLTETAGLDLLPQLAAWLDQSPALLVLDNFEQLLEAAPLLSQLLSECPSLKMLVTSRASLRLSGEQEFPLAPLDSASSDSPAVSLFVQRAQAVKPSFRLDETNRAQVEQICRRLDGLPLALELAAARVKLLPPALLLEKLEDQLKLLVGGPRDLPARQQTIRTSLDWGYELLSENERKLLRRLAVFAGGWSLEAAVAVCGDKELDETSLLEGLQELVNHSLVIVSDQPEPRYHFLEVIRQYAAEKLGAAGEADEYQGRQLNWAWQLTTQAGTYLWAGLDQPRWINRLETEHANLQAALAWGLAHVPELAVRLTAEMAVFWDTRGYLTQGQRWLDLALECDRRVSLPDAVRARLLFAVGWLTHRQNLVEQARQCCDESLAIYRRLGDQEGVTTALLKLGWIAFSQGQTAEARSLLEEGLALARQIDNRYCIASGLSYLGLVALVEWDYERAAPLCEESVRLCRELGTNQFLGWALTSLGAVCLFRADFEGAAAYFEESNHWLEAVGDQIVYNYNLIGLAVVAFMRERLIRAVRLLGLAEKLREKSGAPLLPVFKAPYELVLTFIATQLEANRLQQAWTEGGSMTLEEIMVAPEEATPPALTAALSLATQPTSSTSRLAQPDALTGRELDILRLLAAGLTNAQIAQQLVLSPLTVGSYLRTIYNKLGVNSRSAATRYALEHHLA